MAAGIAACGGGGGTTQPTCTPGSGGGRCAAGESCSRNNDCQVGLSCNTSTSKCEAVFVCTQDNQCTAARNPVCTTPDKCVCIEGACQERACASDASCPGGKVCQSGRCVDRPAAAGLACNILTPPSVIHQGQTVAFTAVAKNQNGAIIPGQTFTWSSSNTAAATIDANGVATGGSASGVTTTNITCTVQGGSGTPSAPVVLTNYGPVDGTKIRVVVNDDRSGQPLAGATVVFEPTGGPGQTVVSDSNGVAEITGTPPVSAHVFKDGYHFVSIIGVSGRDLLVPVLQAPDPTKAGGFKGSFDFRAICDPAARSDCDTVEFGIAGASLPGSFIDLDFTKLIGENLKTRLKFGTIYDQDQNVPSGIVLNLTGQTPPIKGEYRALASPGLHHAWAIGGRAPFDQVAEVLIPIIGGGGGVNDLPFGEILAGVLPFLQRFRHFVKNDQMVVETARIPDVNDINGNGSTNDLVPDYANNTSFPQVVARVEQQLSLSTSVTVPRLPSYDGAFVDGVVVLAGANVTGRGLVPLGISAALDKASSSDTPDGQVQNPLNFRLAPLHSGLEGSRYFVAALALSLDFSASGPAAVSGIVTQTTSIGTTTGLGASSFLGFPETAAFNLSTRRFAFGAGGAVANATFYRADFRTSAGNWVVYFTAPAAGDAFTLPTPPEGIADRAVRTSGCGGAASCTDLRVFALTTTSSGPGTAPNLDELATFGTRNLSGLNNFVSAFSNTACGADGSCEP